MADFAMLLDPIRFTSMEVTTAVVYINSGVYNIQTTTAAFYGIQVKGALIEVETRGIRYCVHGSAPATNFGHTLNTGDIAVLYGPQAIQNFQALQTDASTATLQMTFFYGW